MITALVQCPGWGRDCPPYTLALLSAVLRKTGCDVVNFDLNNSLYCSGHDEYWKYWDDKDLYSFWGDELSIKRFIETNKRMIDFQIERILSSDAQIIGFTVHFTSLLVSLEVARRIKAVDKERIIVFGGPDCCRELRGEHIIKDGSVDVVVIGEGETTLIEIVKEVQKKGKVEFCKGTLIRKDSGFIDCGDAKIVKDLDALPFPDYSDFKDDIEAGLYNEPNRLEILDSRGCITRCHFCSEWQFWKIYRTMSGDRIFEEIRHQIDIFRNVDYFYFIGSLLNGNIKELSRFCDLVIQNNLRIRWAGQAIVRPDMTEELFNKMRRAGCEWLGFGIESGSQRIVHSMNKKFTMKDAENCLRYAHQAGICVQANFMFGIPGEQKDDFRETVTFLKRNRVNMDSILASQSFCVIDKGTYLYNHHKALNIKDQDHHLYWESDDGKNTYPERFRRYEEFCQAAISLGMPETSGVLKTKPDKWYLLGGYYNFKKDYHKALDCYKKSLALESYSEMVAKNMEFCEGQLNKTGEQDVFLKKAPAMDNFKALESQFTNYLVNNGHDITAFKEWAWVRFNERPVGFDRRQDLIIEALYKRRFFSKLFNFILAEHQKARRIKEVSAYPYWMTVDPTNSCNLKCPFCPTGQGRNSRSKAILTFKNFEKIMKELGPYLLHIDFCNWGEPLLNRNIYKMIGLAKEYNIDTRVDSNFNQLSEKTIEQMILSGLDKVNASIDGVTPETYSKYRVGGNFKKAMDNLKLLIRKKKELKRSNPYISWQFLVFRHNEDEIEKAKDMARELGVDHIAITKAFIGDKDWFPSKEEHSLYLKEKNSSLSIGKTDVHFKKPVSNFCNWPWEAIVVNPNGSISPCCSVEDEKDDFGNIFQQPFMEVWNNEKYITAREHIRDKSRARSEDGNICINCRHSGMTNLDILSCHGFFNL